MPHLNHYICIGHLARQPEAQVGQSGKSFTRGCVAVNHEFKKDAPPLWLNFVAFGKTGDFIAQYFDKGDAILLMGQIEPNDYETRDGKEVKSIQMIVDRAKFAAGRNEKANTDPDYGSNERQSNPAPAQDAPGATDDLPF